MFVIETAQAKAARKSSICMMVVLAVTGSFGALFTLHAYARPSPPIPPGLRFFGFPRPRTLSADDYARSARELGQILEAAQKRHHMEKLESELDQILGRTGAAAAIRSTQKPPSGVEGPSMAARFGHVLFWIGWVVGLPFMGLAIFLALNAPSDAAFVTVIIGGLGVLSILIGWACRYVLAGR